MKKIKSTLFIFGSGECGQLPPEYCTDYIQVNPTAVQNLPGDIDEVICGSMHTIIKTKDDKIYSFGCNDMGVLGRKTHTNSIKDAEHFPTLVNFTCTSKIKKITCGDNHTAILLENGKVYVTGGFRDSCGVLGLPFFEKKNEIISKSDEFVEIKFSFSKKNSKYNSNSLQNNDQQDEEYNKSCSNYLDSNGIINKTNDEVKIINIISGEDHLVCLEESREYLFAMGNSDSCQVCNTFYEQGQAEIERLKYVFPKCYHYQDLGFHEKIKNIYCGGNNTFIQLEETLDVYAIGRNAYGSCGVSMKDNIIKKFEKIQELSKTEIVQLCGGQSFTVCLLKNNDLYIWGNREILGMEYKDDAYHPLKLNFFQKKNYSINTITCGTDHCLVLTNDGKLFGWGTGGNDFDENTCISTIEKNFPSEINYVKFVHKAISKDNTNNPDEWMEDKIKIVSFAGGSSHCAFICSHVDPERVSIKRGYDELYEEEACMKKQKSGRYFHNATEEGRGEAKMVHVGDAKGLTHINVKVDVDINEEVGADVNAYAEVGIEGEKKKNLVGGEKGNGTNEKEWQDENIKAYIDEKTKQMQSVEEENIECNSETSYTRKKKKKESFFKDLYYNSKSASNKNFSPSKDEYHGGAQNDNAELTENDILNNEQNKRRRSVKCKPHLSNESPTRRQPRRSCKENTSLNENMHRQYYQIVDTPITKKKRRTTSYVRCKSIKLKTILNENKNTKSKSVNAKRESVGRYYSKRENFKRESASQTPDVKIIRAKSSKMKN
ncbi:regulator of chromosome condensation, putative [Plasmodium malariae]|uniref:Regulator of chromosome condensation, putative n=1 Tax=Plasmodium malariae TaxID=5858 RepID=A0A1A8VLE9_PLAMA|nr:regulator of chromosome condensation, putative [Plasmodium malariae]SBS81417.1 regulator of chromosome condensation, putative [Plasmodium malariae]SBT86939.1 regulator of chromosome condensation, putative [Plasmodium malariae]